MCHIIKKLTSESIFTKKESYFYTTDQLPRRYQQIICSVYQMKVERGDSLPVDYLVYILACLVMSPHLTSHLTGKWSILYFLTTDYNMLLQSILLILLFKLSLFQFAFFYSCFEQITYHSAICVVWLKLISMLIILPFIYLALK